MNDPTPEERAAEFFDAAHFRDALPGTYDALVVSFRAAERAAVEAVRPDPSHIPFVVAKSQEAILTALADAFGLPVRKCRQVFDQPLHPEECRDCNGTGTLPWDVESLADAVRDRADEALCVAIEALSGPATTEHLLDALKPKDG